MPTNLKAQLKANSSLAQKLKKAAPSLPNIEEQREILKLRETVRQLRAANANLHDELDTEERRKQVTEELRTQRMFEAWERERSRSPASHSAILALSDWHFEESVSRELTQGVNEYTPEIARKRVKHTFQKAVEYWHRYTKGSKEFVVACLGDFITGFIHEELEETNHLSPMQAVFEVLECLRSGLGLIERETDAKHIPVPCVFGNHSRTTKKRRIKTEWRHSYEFAMYEQLQRIYANHRKIRVIPARGYMQYLTIQKRTVRFHHGHAIKYAGGVGGITIPVMKKIARWDRERTSSLDVFGHFHSLQAGEGFKWICNGSLIGQNEYGADCGFDPTAPKQLFAVFDAKHGIRGIDPIIAE